ncbi:MAG: stage II sporulation protein R [Tumebacillaceae bacterium]
MRKGWIVAAMIVSVFSMGMGAYQQQAKSAPAPVILEEQQMQDEDLAPIPQNAIRLRIIANSDKPEDQQLKRDVRDKIVAAVAEEVRGVKDERTAREKISLAVPKFEEIAQQVIEEQGFRYEAKTDFGRVSFPTKMYGSQVYPAGDYEALRIQIGEAQGQNWWCVLFPPLCFVDMANADAVAAPQSEPVATVEVKDAKDNEEKPVEVRFALVDKISELWNKIFG